MNGRTGKTRFGAAAEAFLFLAVTVGICAILTTVFFSHRSPKSLTPLEARTSPLTPKVLLIVVDALRADTAFDPARMPHVVDAARRGASGVAVATSLSMTIPGIRAIGTGTASDYLDLFENWAAPVTDKPNLLANLKKAGISTGIIGDRAWATVYRPWLDMIQTETGLSGFDYYIHSTEKPDRIHAERARRAFHDGTAPRFLVVHFVGLDHAGHSFGPQSDRYVVTARSMDEKIDSLIRSVDADTTVVITSDHAITNRGGHGGSDAESRQTPLVMLGRGIRPISGLAVEQVGLTSTLAALLGVPIPAQSTGRIILEALDISDQERDSLRLNRDQLLNLLQATYPSHWEHRLDEARERVRATAFLRSGDRRLSATSRQASETIDAIRQTIDKRDWEDRLPVIAWLAVGLLLCTSLWSSLRQGGAPINAWVAVGAAATILVATVMGLSRSEARLSLSVLACAAMLGVVLSHARNTIRVRSLGSAMLVAIAATVLAGLIMKGRIQQYRSDTMFGDVHDGVAALLGWGFFLVLAIVGTLLRNRWPATHPLRRWGLSAMGVALFTLMGFGGRPLGLASFGPLALLTCAWHFRRTAGMAGLMAPGESLRGKLRPHLKLGGALLLLGLATFLATCSRSYLLLGFIKWKNAGLGVKVAAALLSCPLLLVLWLRDRKTRGASTVTSWGLSLLVGAAALGAVLSLVWPTDGLINGVLLLFALSLPGLAWLGRRRPVWHLALVSLLSAWIVMSDPKGAIAISVIAAYVVLVVPDLRLPDSRPAALVAIGVWILAVRVVVVVLLEGSFNFDSIEIATALMGNLVHAALQGGLRVFLKFALPIFVVGVSLGHVLPYRALIAVIRVALFLIVARVIHLTAGILATSGQFYTPYRLAEELVFYLCFSLTFAICLLLILMLKQRDSGLAPEPSLRESGY